MADTKKKSKKAKARVLNMAKAGEGSNFRTGRIPRGAYLAKVVSVAEGESKAGNDQWVFSLELVKSKYRRTFPYYCGFEENQLWKIRNLFTAAGVNVPKKKVTIDPNKVLGKIVGIEVDDDEYDGKEKSTIADIFPKADVSERSSDNEPDEDDVEEDEDEDEDEAPAKSKKKSKKAAPVEDDDDEDEDDEDEDDEDEDDDDEDEDDDSDSDDDDDDEDEDEDEDEEDDEEEEPEPPKKKKSSKKSSSKDKSAAKGKGKKKKSKPADVEDDELEELEIDELE